MSDAFNSINSFLTYTSLLGAPSNWATYPATANVQMSNYFLSNTRVETTSNLAGKSLCYYNANILSNDFPVFQAVSTNGGGSQQPETYFASKYTYIKNDPFGSPNQLLSLITYFDISEGWTITSEWEGYIGMPLTLGGTPLVLSVGGNDSQQIFLTSVNGGSGKLWVDASGSLYWNSNLIANA